MTFTRESLKAIRSLRLRSPGTLLRQSRFQPKARPTGLKATRPPRTIALAPNGALAGPPPGRGPPCEKTCPRSHTGVPPVTEDQLAADPSTPVFSLGEQKGNSSRPIKLRPSEGLGSLRRKASGSPGNGHRWATPKPGFPSISLGRTPTCKAVPVGTFARAEKAPFAIKAQGPQAGGLSPGSEPPVASCDNHLGIPYQIRQALL